MHLKFRNCNDGFRELVTLFANESVQKGIVSKRPSRQGNVLVIDEPVTITYTHPRERVLFNQARDVNPFWLVYEQLWMLAGRNDVVPLAYYNSKIAEIASDDGVTFNGAYGYRWRNPQYINMKGEKLRDQLDLLVNHLKVDPNSRRAVLQMWNVEDDLLKIGMKDGQKTGNDFMSLGSKDVCCNLSVMFSLQQTNWISAQGVGIPDKPVYSLDITVTNRSNDLVWGLLGSDYVTFTILQEYMAARLGCEVGVYNHFTSNLHVYDWNWKPEAWLNEHEVMHDQYRSIENGSVLNFVPLVKDPAVFERELHEVVDCCWGAGERGERETLRPILEEPFLQNVAVPMFGAFAQHKLKNYEGAMSLASSIDADDWRIVATNWLTKRNKK